MKFLIELSLDGYDNADDERVACIKFIEESLDCSASSVHVLESVPDVNGRFISEQWYKELLDDSKELDALESYGVDNWEGYSDAQKSIREERGEE